MYKAGWLECPDIWCNDSLAEDFETLKEVRDIVLRSLENARSKDAIGSSLESEVYIQTHDQALDLMGKHFSLLSPNYSLADFFIVSKVHATHVELPTTVGFRETGTVSYQDRKCPITVGVAKANFLKCARCWRHVVRPTEDKDLCDRCNVAIDL